MYLFFSFFFLIIRSLKFSLQLAFYNVLSFNSFYSLVLDFFVLAKQNYINLYIAILGLNVLC